MPLAMRVVWPSLWVRCVNFHPHNAQRTHPFPQGLAPSSGSSDATPNGTEKEGNGGGGDGGNAMTAERVSSSDDSLLSSSP